MARCDHSDDGGPLNQNIHILFISKDLRFMVIEPPHPGRSQRAAIELRSVLSRVPYMTVRDCDGYDRILTVRPMGEHRVTECVSAISVHVRST